MNDCAAWVASRGQLTVGAYTACLEAVENAFGGEIDYAQLDEVHDVRPDGETRYSPSACIGTQVNMITGSPNSANISTN